MNVCMVSEFEELVVFKIHSAVKWIKCAKSGG